MYFFHFAIEIFSLSSKHIVVCVLKQNRQRSIIKKNMYGILKSAPFCLQSNVLKCPILIQPY